MKRMEIQGQDNHKEVNNNGINVSAKTLEEFKSKMENIASQNKSLGINSVEGYQDQGKNMTNTTLSKTPSISEMHMATITAAAK